MTRKQKLKRIKEKLGINEVGVKDLNMRLLGKRKKAELIRIISHIGSIANEYTRPGDGLVGDRALSKLNLTRPRFKIRRRPVPENMQELAVKVLEANAAEKVRRKKHPNLAKWEPKPGDRVKIIKSSVFWAPGKAGELIRASEGGWIVKVHYRDSFIGETEARDHEIWAEVIELFVPPPEPPPANPT